MFSFGFFAEITAFIMSCNKGWDDHHVFFLKLGARDLMCFLSYLVASC